FAIEQRDGFAPHRLSDPAQRRCPRTGPRHFLTVTHGHRSRDAIGLESSLDRDVVRIAFPLRRNGEAERAVSEFDLGDWPRAAARSHELPDQSGGAGPSYLEPRWRRLSVALHDEIPSAQQRIGCGATVRKFPSTPWPRVSTRRRMRREQS